jgi:hypothetical protein
MTPSWRHPAELLAGNWKVAALALLLSAAVSPLVFTMGKISDNPDFLQLAARHALLRTAVLEQGRIPLWTPYLNGGFPSVGDPEDPALSPFSVLTVLFGEIAGLKLIALLVFLSGCAGMYRLSAGVFNASVGGAALGTAVFGLSGWFITRLYGGNINELYYFLTPVILLFLEKYWADGDGRWLFFSSVSLAAVAMDGKTSFLVILLFLAAYSLLRGAWFRPGRGYTSAVPLKFLLAAAAALALACVKIIPVLELFAAKGSVLHPVLDTHSALYGETVAFGWKDFLRGLLLPGAGNGAVSLYLGPIPLLLALWAFAGRGRALVWAVLAAVFAALWAGPNSPVDLLRVLWKLPFFSVISQPHKYFDFPVLFCLCAAIPAGYDAIMALAAARPRSVRPLAAVLTAAALAPLMAFSVPKYAKVFSLPQPVLSKGEFYQLKLPGSELDGMQMYLDVLQNVGTINWYGAIRLPSTVQARYAAGRVASLAPNKDYLGEVFCLKKENQCGPAYFAANSMGAVASIHTEDRLVFNQNYASGWRSASGMVENYGGLLSVAVKPSALRQAVLLEYSPRGVRTGAAVSLFAFCVLFVWSFRRAFLGWFRSAGVIV